MKNKAYLISVCAAVFIAVASLAASAVAQAPAKQSLKERMQGSWQLVSVTVGEAQPYGTNPRGLMYIGADGEFSVVAIGEGMAQKIAYLGTYTVDDPGSSITFHVVATTSATGQGGDHKWLVSFEGGEMTENLASPTGGRGAVSIVWKRGS